jgi:hypothetical protein
MPRDLPAVQATSREWGIVLQKLAFLIIQGEYEPAGREAANR